MARLTIRSIIAVVRVHSSVVLPAGCWTGIVGVFILYSVVKQEAVVTTTYLVLLWMCGLAGIVIVGRKFFLSTYERERVHSLLRTLMDTLPDEIYVKDCAGRYLLNNASHVHSLGKTTTAELAGKTVFDVHPLHLAAKYHMDEQQIIRSAEPLVNEEEQYICRETGETRWHSTTKMPIRNSLGIVTGIVGISRDITDKKRLEGEREQLIGELKAALADIKTLSGLIPICSNCKKIRGDEGYWTQIEKYLQEHSEAQFSHGICPECASHLYPEYFQKLTGSGEKGVKPGSPASDEKM